jgi:S-DNA-T family DNA segregation ATPase FtsK/SpoIIIE
VFFNRNPKDAQAAAATRRRLVPRGQETGAVDLSPRFARLVREAFWLVVVAGFLYLALILATYSRRDPGWSFSGSGDGAIGNRGGFVGAWLSDLLLYLFGVSAWWWVVAGVVLVVAGYRHVIDPDRAREHPLPLRVVGFALVLLSSAALEAIRLWKLPVTLPLAPGGAIGDALGGLLTMAIGFNGATLLLLALFAAGSSLFFGISWLRVMERIGAGADALVASIRRWRDARIDRRIGEEQAAAREHLVDHLREETQQHEPVIVVPPPAAAPRSERVI